MEPLMSSDEFMRVAIAKAYEGIANGQTPFGACIVKHGQVLSSAHNVVWQSTDITAHAEIHAIRLACSLLGSIALQDCTIYSTTEPCPMCFSACHWARIATIYYGTSIDTAAAYGFNELAISNADLRRLGRSEVEVVGGILVDENLALFERWSERRDHRAY